MVSYQHNSYYEFKLDQADNSAWGFWQQTVKLVIRYILKLGITIYAQNKCGDLSLLPSLASFTKTNQVAMQIQKETAFMFLVDVIALQ